MKIETTSFRHSKLGDLFLNELRELYGAEKHQMVVLPLLKKAASSLKLRNVLSSHLEDTREHIHRLDLVFAKLKRVAEALPPEAIFGITREAEQVISATAAGSATRDAGLIVAAQKMQHYEISAYGSLATHARTMDEDDIEHVLELTLCEEKETDELLTALAENYINVEASRE
jgi:ferritin-like metal-binding protein YciE